MRCPGCGLYHPPEYEKCISCGTSLGAASTQDKELSDQAPLTITQDPLIPATDEFANGETHHLRRSKLLKGKRFTHIPVAAGIGLALIILLLSAGATIFFLTKPTDDEMLYGEASHQLANGQYAFAVKSLEHLAASRPHDARVFLLLARAYVGIDQVDKAWDCINQAQQMGQGLIAEPMLASDLANYYRQKQQYDKAIELIRPLAEANVQNKRAELADLDALWGDEALSAGKVDLALKCWEEVRDLHEGSRYTEADARLATIYQRITNNLIAKQDDDKALAYLSKLNTIAESVSNYERSADIYERRDQLEMAIDQLRRATKLPTKTADIDKRLASLMARRGKELLDQGDTATGYGYLQQARTLDPVNVVPTVTIRNTVIAQDAVSHFPTFAGQIWNPGANAVKLLTIRVELWNRTNAKLIWQQEQRVIDEFVAPLLPQESRDFDVTAPLVVANDGSYEFKVFIDNGLYKAYPIGQPSQAASTSTTTSQKREEQSAPATVINQQPSPKGAQSIPSPSTPTQDLTPPKPSGHPEESTIKDLEL